MDVITQETAAEQHEIQQPEKEQSEKTYTLRSAKSELARVEKARAKKEETIKRLKAEIKADNAKIKELAGRCEQLRQDDLQKKIQAAWLKEKRLSPEQITKFLEISVQIGDDLDAVSVDEIVQLIKGAAKNVQHPAQPATPKVDTSSNFSNK